MEHGTDPTSQLVAEDAVLGLSFFSILYIVHELY